MNPVDTHLSVKNPYPLDEFYIMFNDHLRHWIVNQKGKADEAGISIKALDGHIAYAESVNVPVEVVKALSCGETVQIPASIMLDMRIKLSKQRVLVPEERFIIVSDEETEKPKRNWFKR